MNIKLDRNIYEERKSKKEKRRLIETSKITPFQIILLFYIAVMSPLTLALLYYFKFISLSIFIMFDVIWFTIGILGEKRRL